MPDGGAVLRAHRFDGAGGAGIGRAPLAGRTLLVPHMSAAGSTLMAACFRAAGAEAVGMETFRGLDMGREHTSGKECFPCQVTLGDVLHHLRAEQRRLGGGFRADRYAYFLPEADGPCRFGMYNTLQRLVLDGHPEFREVPVVSLSTSDGYAAGGLLPPGQGTALRQMVFQAACAADVLDRIVARARPYERVPGSVDALATDALARLSREIEGAGLSRGNGHLAAVLSRTAREARGLVAGTPARRPLVGVVGEIFLRCHEPSNQGLVRALERHGVETVTASLAEWITFVTYTRAQKKAREARRAGRRGRLGAARGAARAWAGAALEYRWLNRLRRRHYAAAREHLDIVEDHAVHEAERALENGRHFSFDVGTEAALSIGSALEHVRHGFDGIVNVYPFTCMPGTMANAVLRPLLAELGVPFLEAPCDGTRQPSRETAVQTFAYQAAQRRGGRAAVRARS